ncbi:MAG: late competence development ComFB family protein [Spirochaetales bacterium]|nr:late competence development ComFB family protein [Spirochaetales bacterium]
MEIHNLMEEIVVSTVDSIFGDEKSSGASGFCTCDQCRFDAICYVLNRVTPQYVISGRGLAHYETEIQKNMQRNVDLVMLVHQAIETVEATRRPGSHHQNVPDSTGPVKGPVYNFPTIVGRLFNGKTFEPVSNVDIYLLDENGEKVEMIDGNWQNPYRIVNNTSGNFIFWPGPVPTKKSGTGKSFKLELRAESGEHGKLDHFFRLDLVSERAAEFKMQIEEACKVEDLYMFRETEI